MTYQILDQVNAYLLTKITPYASIYNEVFPSVTAKEIMSRTDPGEYNETRYMDRSRIGQFNFSYYCKSDDMEEARQQLSEILDALDLPILTQISDITQVKIEPVTSPAWIQKTEKNEFVYTASLRLEYFKGV